MPKNRNEIEALVRQNPFAYAAGTFVAGGPTYEAWGVVGAAFTEAKWICCKHSYDGSNNLIRTQWAQDTNNVCGDFTNVIGTTNTSADLLSGLNYV